VLLKRPNRCKLAHKLLDTVWGPDGMNTSSEQMMLISLGGSDGRHVVRTDGTVDRWASGRDGSIVRTADRELEIILTCRQNRLTSTLNSGIPVYNIFTLK
jgi:hypothetical protein